MYNDINDILLETFNKSIEEYGQYIRIYDNNKTYLTTVKAIVIAQNIINTDTNYYSYVSDLYKISVNYPVKLNYYIQYKNKQYKIDSIDDTRPYNIAFARYDAEIVDTYKIVIDSTSTSIKKDKTYQINATCYKNAEVVTDAIVTYVSNNTNVATVTNYGLVKGIAKGTTNIVCSWNNVSTQFAITVTEDTPPTPSHNYNIRVVDDMTEDFINTDSNGYYEIKKGGNYYYVFLYDNDTKVILTDNDYSYIDNNTTHISDIAGISNNGDYSQDGIIISSSSSSYVKVGNTSTLTITYNNVQYEVKLKLIS